MGNDTPYYKLNDFIAACADNQVEVWPPASRDAEYFGFKDRDKRKIIKFIAQKGLENLQFINSSPLRKTPEKPPPITDSYSFRSGGKMGYISFYKQPRDGKWKIKSFKRNEQSNTPLAEQLTKLNLK